MRKTFYFAVADKCESKMLTYIFYLNEDEFQTFITLLRNSKSIRGACVDAAINAEFVLPEKEIQKTGRPYAICSVDSETIDFYGI